MGNDTSTDAAPGSKPASVEDLEKYLLHGSREIIKLLRDLGKKPDLVTARIAGSGHAMMTSVIEVLPNKDLVVLDYGPNDALNKKVLEAKRLLFTTRHEMVEVRFSCDRIRRVKYKGESAFAVPIPDSLLWLQRREFFRVKPLVSQPIFCQLNRHEQDSVRLRVIDISVSGLALGDPEFLLPASAGDLYQACSLELPGATGVTVNLEARYMVNTLGRENEKTGRIGALFSEIDQKDEYKLQRLINAIQIEQHALSKG